MGALIEESVDRRVDFVDAAQPAQPAMRLMGDATAANLFLTGFAFQKGRVPLSARALLKAMEIDGVAVKATQAAVQWAAGLRST